MAPEVQKGCAQIAQSVSRIRLLLHSPAQEIEGFCGVTLVQFYQAKQVKRGKIICIVCERGAIVAFGLGELAITLALEPRLNIGVHRYAVPTNSKWGEPL